MDPATVTIIISAALAVSELLALIPSVKANGIFHAIYIGLAKISGR